MNKSVLKDIRELLLSVPVITVLIIYLIVCFIIVPDFATTTNLFNIISQSCVLILMASGLNYVVLNGSVDLSIISIVSLSSVVGGIIMNNTNGLLKGNSFAVPIAIVAMLLVGLIIGAINGFAVTVLKMPAFIVTMSLQMVGSGLGLWITQSRAIGNLPNSFNYLGNGFLPIIITAFFVAILGLILARTLFGRNIYSVGTNPKTARISGLPVKVTIFSIFVVSGICGALAGILVTAQNATASPTYASTMFNDIIASVVIGGTSIFGGRGTIWGTVVGAIFIKTIDTSLNIMGMSSSFIDIVKGVVIIVAALADIIVTSVRSRSKVVAETNPV